MVRMGMAVNPTEDLAAALHNAYPELEAVRAASAEPIYLVGGAVRDLLLGHGRSDLDLVVVGDAANLAASLGGEAIEHERFATVKVQLDGHEIDIATARAETYPYPGALPEVEPASSIEADLRRRDFTINAMAVPLRGEAVLVDPYGGHDDLQMGLIGVLHDRSFVDDPTRALRAARYAARFGFWPDTRTGELIRQADLNAVSADRRQAELLRLAAEPSAARALGLLDDWGLIEILAPELALVERVIDLLSSPPWQGFAPRDRAVLAALEPPGEERGLTEAQPEQPSQGVALAAGSDPIELVLARARGAEWLDRYLLEWRTVKLEIDGEDLIAAGVPQGPDVGRGLSAALRRKLDGEISGRDEELAAALEAIRSPG